MCDDYGSDKIFTDFLVLLPYFAIYFQKHNKGEKLWNSMYRNLTQWHCLKQPRKPP